MDALGNPLKIILTAGQVHDLAGADALVPGMEADALLADKAYDADERVIEPLEAAGKTAVIPPKKNRKTPRTYDKVLYEARHLMENFFCGRNSSVPSRHVTTRPPEIFWPRST